TQAVEMNEKFKSKNYEDCIKYYSDLNSGSKPKSLEMDEFDSITYDALMARAEKIGLHTLEIIKYLIDKKGNMVYCKRQCLGIIKVAELTEPEIAEKAAEYLMEIPDKRYSVYKNIIKNRSYLQLKKKEISYSAYCTTIHNNIRGKEYYE
nr:hypothetical protein [Candidatus Cloacimonadota bacterium]